MWTKFQRFLGRTFREEDDDGGTLTPAQINDRGNRSRLDRLARIANSADGNRASELSDVEGDRVTGRFQGGELDDSPEARERAAEEEEERAQQALAEQREQAEREEQENARRLQSEGVPQDADDDEPAGQGNRGQEAEEGDERIINGVKHYAVPINGAIQWLTLKQLREDRSKVGGVEKALQSAQAALQSATDASLRPNPADDEIDLDESDLENVLTSAVLGDGEAIKKLVPLLKRSTPGVSPQEIEQVVSRRLATQRLLDESEAEQADLLGHKVLGPVFRQRLDQMKRTSPNTRINEAFRQVGDSVRKDFAAMIPHPESNGSATPPKDKAARKRTLVSPPTAASRQQSNPDPDREVPVADTIDQIARSRGQSRAIRQSRR